MKRKQIVLLVAMVLIASFVISIPIINKKMFEPIEYSDLSFAMERGLFQDLEVVDGSCTFEIPPSLRSPALFLFHSFVNIYGKASLSESVVAELLHTYEWKKWSISSEEWERGISNGYASPYLFEFNNLKEQLTDKELLISEEFDTAHMHGINISTCNSFLDLSTNSLLFFYHSS